MSHKRDYEPELPLRPAVVMFHEDGLADENRCMVCRAWREPCVKCRPEEPEAKLNGKGKSPRYRQVSAALDKMLGRNGG